MTAILQNVIDALRNELQQYGEMLALLEAQFEGIFQAQSQLVLTSISSVESQGAAIESARLARETHQRQLAWSLGRPESAPFQELFPLLPEDYRPLIEALVHEVNQLIDRVRECARQNHLQLRRSLELMERFLADLFPEVQPTMLFGESISTGSDAPDNQAPAAAV